MFGHLCEPFSEYCGLVTTLFSTNIYFKSEAEYHWKIEAISATNLERYSQVQFLLIVDERGIAVLDDL